VELTLEQLKEQWNQVLDALLDQDRIAWLAYFDARLVSLENGELTLSFADVSKFGGPHDYKSVRKPEHLAKLRTCIASIAGVDLAIVEV
jgi:hypothetical protein